jgi:hypothetical protein
MGKHIPAADNVRFDQGTAAGSQVHFLQALTDNLPYGRDVVLFTGADDNGGIMVNFHRYFLTEALAAMLSARLLAVKAWVGDTSSDHYRKVLINWTFLIFSNYIL